MPPFEIIGLTAFILMIFVGLFSTLFGFPGTVVIVLSAIVYACATGFQTIGFKVLLSLIVISALAESLEFWMGAAGAKKFDFTRRGLAAAAVGGVSGAFLLTPFLMGLGTVMGALFGSYGGLFLVEIIRERNLKPSARAGPKALLGGVTGSLAKGVFALIMVIIALSAIYS